MERVARRIAASPGATVFALALLARVAIVVACPTGFPSDMRGWVEAARYLREHGIAHVYDTRLQANAYPPLYFWPLWFAAYLPDPEMALRATAILADAACAAAVWRIGRTWLGARAGLGAGLLYALNPAILVNVAWMGMIGDPWFLLPALLAVGALGTDRPGRALPWFALSLLIKPQALALAPLVAVVLLARTRPRDLARPSLAAGALVAVAVAPFALSGTWVRLIAAVLRFGTRAPFAQNYAANLWMLATATALPARVPDRLALAGPLTINRAGVLLFAAIVAACAALLWRDRSPRALLSGAAILALGFFAVATRMHVNYSFAAFPFLCLLAAGERRARLALAAATVGCLLNWAIEETPALAQLPPALGSPGAQCVAALLYLAAFALVLSPALAHLPLVASLKGRRPAAPPSPTSPATS